VCAMYVAGIALACSFCCRLLLSVLLFLCFHNTMPPDIYSLSLHDALPILHGQPGLLLRLRRDGAGPGGKNFPGTLPQGLPHGQRDRKSTRLNSSHVSISYAVFCLKKKRRIRIHTMSSRQT